MLYFTNTRDLVKKLINIHADILRGKIHTTWSALDVYDCVSICGGYRVLDFDRELCGVMFEVWDDASEQEYDEWLESGCKGSFSAPTEIVFFSPLERKMLKRAGICWGGTTGVKEVKA